MAGLVSAVLIVVGITLIAILLRSSRSRPTVAQGPVRPRIPAAAPESARPVPLDDEPATARVGDSPTLRPVPEIRPELARPGVSGSLFSYGGDCAGYLLRAPYAVVEIATTGFSPRAGDRIVEISIARVDAEGRIEDEYSTLLDPGRDVGPVFSHGISNIDVLEAPRFEQVAGDVMAWLDGAIVVAHNAAFVERFLTAEFERARMHPPAMPALCTLWLAQQTMRTPNAKLGTLARSAGIRTATAHSALADVRTVAALLPQLLDLHGRPLQYPCTPTPMPRSERGARPRPRALEPRTGTDGWMASMMARLAMPASEVKDADIRRYLDVFAAALEDGRPVGHEAPELARLAGSAGLGTVQVHGLHRRFLEALRSVALAGAIVTTVEIRQLRMVADLLGMPGYFAELRPTSPQDLIAAGRVPGLPVV